MKKLKLKKGAGGYKAGEVLTVIEGGMYLHRDGSVADTDGKPLKGNFIDPGCAASWSDAGYFAKPKKEAGS
jgi:hypothetical protein